MAKLDNLLFDIFGRENIRFYTVMSLDACHVIHPHMIEKLTFQPRTVILFLVPYYVQETENISRYAAGGDYHRYTAEFFRLNTPILQSASNGHHFAGFCDHSPIDERHAAATAGLGMMGDNGLLIHEEYGSFVFIAEWLTDAPPEYFTHAKPREIQACEHCGACARACPAGNLPHFSAEKCVSAITQKKGELTEEEIGLVRQNGCAWGCDTCQTACPHNRKIIEEGIKAPIPFFSRSYTPCMTSDVLSRMSDEEFDQRAYSYRKREVLERNLKLLGY